ncbi:cyclase family protein [Alicyclobacillus vulcanalis]|uniref:Putative cyclase n=1 Tax=Alicyclobacillus vulcanalis TaxID=252246 RepID=A0A1N7KVN9_9BACL|nr:cyclase family protein [Alicyclobacillus vulcanalis]SIS65668.1 Putative cyclase [Alicyclobacillus vulcanalis]
MSRVTVSELLQGAPKNWGKWGPEDEIGSLNYLTPEEVLRGVRSVRSGKTFTLGAVIGHPKGDPVWPGRTGAMKLMTQDKGHYLSHKVDAAPGGLEYADDYITMFLQGTTQFDALGHTWYDDQIWNGYDAKETIGGMGKASVLPIAEHGVVGRAVLLDMARHRGKPSLSAGETFGVEDLLACAASQNVDIEPHDILVIRTGWLKVFYEQGPEAFYGKVFNEPGLTYSPELVDWFQRMEIPVLATDTIANETTVEPETGVVLPLHNALMRNLGVLFNEILWLEDLADDCAADGQYTFLYVGAPLKIYRGTGAPVNPVAIK